MKRILFKLFVNSVAKYRLFICWQPYLNNKVFKDVEMVCEKLRVENCTKYNLFCINYFLQELWFV